MAVVLVACAMAPACGRARTEPRASPATVRIGPESVARVVRAQLRSGPILSGTLQPGQEATVRAEVGGTVLEAPFDVGHAVRKGAVMARIEAPELRAAVTSAQAEVASAQTALNTARRDRERTETLVRGGALSQRDLENAGAALAGAQAQLAAARARLSDARHRAAGAVVEAPISGVVSARSARRGDVVTPGGELFTIIDPTSMRLEADVPSDEVASLRTGAPVEFTLRGYEQQFTGTVERISPQADPATGQVQVFVAIPNPGGRIVAGLHAEGRVTTAVHTGLVVPAAAVDESAPSPAVTRVRGGRAERVTVTLGVRDEKTQRVEVRSGLQEGDQVLQGPARSVAAGTPVTVASR
jgi:RND family efflux transporter MFP subunit